MISKNSNVASIKENAGCDQSKPVKKRMVKLEKKKDEVKHEKPSIPYPKQYDFIGFKEAQVRDFK